ncbi:MAG: bifunctional folylpolyglutamate synthase/dihydrofolate synthase [Spirochaetaceae bacterium]
MAENPASIPTAFTGAEEVFAFFQEFTNFEQKQKQTIREYRLDRMRHILSIFGDPHLSIKVIHAAGSKGKGSTSLYIAKALEALGEKTGLYTSPHVTDYRERITFAGTFVPDTLIVAGGNRILGNMELLRGFGMDGSDDPTTFELLTLLAFLVFEEGGCTYGVIETGIGGRLDATNVVEPEAAVITPIELEHTDILGNTLREIAGEKAGIIKAGVPLFVSPQHEEPMQVLLRKAEEKKSPLYRYSDRVLSASFSLTTEGTVVAANLKNPGAHGENLLVDFTLPILGKHQGENALLALSLITVLFRPDKESLGNITEALEQARLPGRLELIDGDPPVLLDGAHTPNSVGLVLDAYREVFALPPICIFGSVYGKNAEGMASILSPHCAEIIISRPGSFKPSEPEEILRIFSKYSSRVELLSDPRKAFEKAIALSEGCRPILVTGSFYMVAEVRPFCSAGAALLHKDTELPKKELP